MFPVIYAQLRIILFAIKESTQHQGVSQFDPSLMDLFFFLPPWSVVQKTRWQLYVFILQMCSHNLSLLLPPPQLMFLNAIAFILLYSWSLHAELDTAFL